jgi:hypothetical protein
MSGLIDMAAGGGRWGAPALRGGLPATAEGQELFASVMSRLHERAGARPRSAEEARRAARDLVSITFVQPVLAMARESHGAAAPFAPTHAERQFRAVLDATVAQRVVEAARFPLVERVARDLLARTPGA